MSIATLSSVLIALATAAAETSQPAAKPAAATSPAAAQAPAKPASKAAAKPAAKTPAKPAAKKLTTVFAQDGSGVFGYKDSPIQPWSGFHVHDPDRPRPKRVDPGPAPEKCGPVPADAVVLFNGGDLSAWQPNDWRVVDGCLEAVGHTLLSTKEKYGSCQLHLEWKAPNPPEGAPNNRGNNGVLLDGFCEIQIFDQSETKLYADGIAASVYGQTPPLVDASRGPGQWQTYDIFFTAPKVQDGKVVQPARITMLHNGVLVHLNQEIYGTTPHGRLGTYEGVADRGSLGLMAHNNPVRFRNIWIRPLD